ncbi:DUF5666 domain-containing protein [Chloroflexota bacterium]
MSKKVLILIISAVFVAVVAGAWVSTTAFAKEGGFGDRLRVARRGLGQVISIADDQFTIQRQDGETFTILIDDETNYRGKDQVELSFDDLKVDGWVIVIPVRPGMEKIMARAVFILPDEFDPNQFGGARGLITSVDIAADQFSLETDEGAQLTFDINDETNFWGDLETLADLDLDMEAIVRSQEQEDGSLLALGVMSGSFDRASIQRNLGRVLEVDPDNSIFVLQVRSSDDPLVFQVDENTRYHSRDQIVQSLEDLQPEMIVAVGARQQDDGTLLAFLVAAATRDQLPSFESRAAGRVTAVEHNSFTILARNGETYSILVTGDSIFRGQNGQVQSLDDLQVDMPVFVGGKELGNGQHQYQAKLVLVLPRTR